MKLGVSEKVVVDEHCVLCSSSLAVGKKSSVNVVFGSGDQQALAFVRVCRDVDKVEYRFVFLQEKFDVR